MATEENKNNDKKNKPKGGFKFSIEWLYVSIAIILLAMYFVNPSAPTKEVSYSEFDNYMRQQYVEKLVVISNKDIVRAYIKKDAMKKVFKEDADKYKNEPYIESRIASAENFDDYVLRAKKDYKFNGEVRYEESKDYMEGFLWNVLPFIILIAVWIFIMRRMSGGASGGGPGGVFNVGKSKAQLFDKGSAEKKITFIEKGINQYL